MYSKLEDFQNGMIISKMTYCISVWSHLKIALKEEETGNLDRHVQNYTGRLPLILHETPSQPYLPILGDFHSSYMGHLEYPTFLTPGRNRAVGNIHNKLAHWYTNHTGEATYPNRSGPTTTFHCNNFPREITSANLVISSYTETRRWRRKCDLAMQSLWSGHSGIFS